MPPSYSEASGLDHYRGARSNRGFEQEAPPTEVS